MLEISTSGSEFSVEDPGLCKLMHGPSVDNSLGFWLSRAHARFSFLVTQRAGLTPAEVGLLESLLRRIHLNCAHAIA